MRLCVCTHSSSRRKSLGRKCLSCPETKCAICKTRCEKLHLWLTAIPAVKYLWVGLCVNYMLITISEDIMRNGNKQLRYIKQTALAFVFVCLFVSYVRCDVLHAHFKAIVCRQVEYVVCLWPAGCGKWCVFYNVQQTWKAAFDAFRNVCSAVMCAFRYYVIN